MALLLIAQIAIKTNIYKMSMKFLHNIMYPLACIYYGLVIQKKSHYGLINASNQNNTRIHVIYQTSTNQTHEPNGTKVNSEYRKY